MGVRIDAGKGRVMATTHNALVTADEAQAMLQDMADGRSADDIAARARAFYRLGDTVIALHATIARLTAALDSERTVVREMREAAAKRQCEIATLLPDDPAEWSSADIAWELAQARQEVMRLTDRVTDTTLDLHGEREKVAALRTERDDTLRRLDLATETARASDRSLYAIRHALDGTAVPPPGDSLARQVYEVAQREADFAADLRAARAAIEGRATPPSLTEIATHEAAGGRWLIALAAWDNAAPLVFVLDRGVIDVQAYRGDARVTRWWKLDATGRLCTEPSSEGGAT